MRKSTILFLALICMSVSMFAQTKGPQSAGDRIPLMLGITDQIKSTELGETRKVNIYFPEGYNPASDTAYPVIYLLDGGADEDFIHISGIVQFLSQIVDTMPRAIVVGIANTDRKRDFTFSHSVGLNGENIPTSGGSAKFIAFIEKELIPYMQKRYKCGEYRTLIGQSLGGLLASEILLKKPDLFDNYLIVSPSLWWSSGSLLAEAPKLAAKGSYKNIHAFIAVGDEGKEMEDDAKKLTGILHGSGRTNLKVDFIYLKDENHKTILHNAAYKGLEILFAK